MTFPNREYNSDVRQYFSTEVAEMAELLQISPGWANRQLSRGLCHVQTVVEKAREAYAQEGYTETVILALPEEWLESLFDLVRMPD